MRTVLGRSAWGYRVVTAYRAGMARFLSREWFEALNVAAASDDVRDRTRAVHLVLRQIVVGGPQGDVEYSVAVDDGDVAVRAGTTGRADATFTEDYDTAAAINRGELSPQEAFMTGRIRISGNVGVLVASQEVLAGLAPALATVRPSTTY